MKPRTFKTPSAVQHFVAAHPQRQWHLTINHGDACRPERCRCRPTYVVQEATPELMAEMTERAAKSKAREASGA